MSNDTLYLAFLITLAFCILMYKIEMINVKLNKLETTCELEITTEVSE